MLDSVFYLISDADKKNRPLTLSEILLKQHTLDKLNLDQEKMQKVVAFLEIDEKIFKDDSDNYRIHPKANAFVGYAAEASKEKKVTKRKATIDNFFRVLTISCTLIFGCISVWFNYLNNKQSKGLAARTVEINQLRHTVDSIKIVVGIIVSNDHSKLDSPRNH